VSYELVTSHATDSITVATKVVIPYEIQQDVRQVYEQQFINLLKPSGNFKYDQV
jgi:hypothetical protein